MGECKLSGSDIIHGWRCDSASCVKIRIVVCLILESAFIKSEALAMVQESRNSINEQEDIMAKKTTKRRSVLRKKHVKQRT